MTEKLLVVQPSPSGESLRATTGLQLSPFVEWGKTGSMADKWTYRLAQPGATEGFRSPAEAAERLYGPGAGDRLVFRETIHQVDVYLVDMEVYEVDAEAEQ